jgi:VanZ family protein
MRRTAIVVGILALLSLLLVIRISPTTAWLHVALDAGHGPIFAAVAILLALLLEPAVASAEAADRPDWVRYRKVLVLCIALGALIEFLQGFEGRPPSLFDVMTDTAGAMVGLALWALGKRYFASAPHGSLDPQSWAVIALGLVGITFVLLRPLHAATAYARRSAIFPAIAEFNRPVDLYFTTSAGVAAAITELPARWSKLPGERAMELRYAPGHPPAVQIVEPSGDWRGYDVIAADLTNSGPVVLSLVFRVLDARHDWSNEDRFNLPLLIPPMTRTTVRVALSAVEAAPASRRMDMSHIANVMIFGHEPAATGALYVTRIWLE